MKNAIAFYLMLLLTHWFVSCTIHEPFSGEPLVCFRKKCRAKKMIARRISKSRSSKKKSKFHVNGKYIAGPGKHTSHLLVPGILTVLQDTTTDSMFVQQPDTTTIIVRFDFDSYELTAEDKIKLYDVKRKIALLDYSFIYIHGHTDNMGSEQYNLTLSQKRASLVKAFLVDAGMPSDKMETVAHGSQMPLNSNSSDADRKMNRRVEFKILTTF